MLLPVRRLISNTRTGLIPHGQVSLKAKTPLKRPLLESQRTHLCTSASDSLLPHPMQLASLSIRVCVHLRYIEGQLIFPS